MTASPSLATMSDAAVTRAYDRASITLGEHYAVQGRGYFHADRCCNDPHRRWGQLQAEMLRRGLNWRRP